MIIGERIAKTRKYLKAQTHAARFVDEEELGSFVVSGIDTLASEHFEPVVRELGKAVLETESRWLNLELRNSSTTVMVNPPLESLLPARLSEEIEGDHFEGLLLPMDGGFLKIQTKICSSISGVDMQIVSYGHASQAEVAIYREKRAELDDIVPRGATLLIPRREVEYTRW